MILCLKNLGIWVIEAIVEIISDDEIPGEKVADRRAFRD